jgi:hypothetical protein
MRPPDNDPAETDLEKLGSEEERLSLDDVDLPEDVKAEILKELDSFDERDRERARGDAPRRF